MKRETEITLLHSINRVIVPIVIVIFISTIFILLITQQVSGYALSNSYFNVQTGSYGEISSLKLTGDTYATDYVMNATNSPNQNTSEHEWVGELMFTYRLGTGSWTKAFTNKSGDVRTQSQSGNAVTVTYQNSANSQGIKNFKLVETYSLVNDYFYWQITLTNTSSQSIEFGDIGLPLPFNEIWPNEEIYETRTIWHSFTGKNSSYIYVTRPSGVGPFLLMTPDTSTGAGFEYQDHWRAAEHPESTAWCQDQAGWANGLNVFYINSSVIKSTNRGYLPNTSTILSSGQSKTYAFKFFKVADLNAMKDRIYSEGLIDFNVVPGMIVPTNQTAKFDLHTSQTILSVTAQYPSETTITFLGTVATNHKIYQLTMSHLGQNNITINYGNGLTTTLQFYVIEPIDTAIQRHATFMVQNQQVNDSSKFYYKVFDDWMMDTKSKRNNFSGYMGWGDDWGYTHGEFLAEKNALTPVASEVNALDQYLETCIWNTIMNGHHTDYKVHDWFRQTPYTDDMARAFAYPHVSNTYFSMYKIAKLHPNLVSYINPRTTYLLRAYNIYMVGASLSPGTGLMGESTAPELVAALRDEGYTTEANNVIARINTKYNNFRNTKYPYGSEYNYDNTGEEAVYTYAKMNNNSTMMSKINDKTRACRGTQPVWYYYANPVTICGENWWNFQYSVSLVGYCMDDWLRNYSTTSETDQRLSYAAKIAGISTINSGQIDSDPANIGTVAWTYQAEKGNIYGGTAEGGTLHNGWRQMSGEADLGLFGAIRILSSDVAVDPIFGLYGYGCDVTQSGSNYVITPKDGIFKRLNLITQKFGMALEQDQYTAATVATTKDYVEFTLKNQETAAHTTKIIFSGLAANAYDILVNGTKVGAVNAYSGQNTVVYINVGTASTYGVKLQKGSGTVSDLIAYYRLDETSGTSAADSSGNGKNSTLNGGVSWTAGRNGNAVSLNGSDGYVSMPAGIMNGLNDFTVVGWIRLNSNSTWNRIFDFGTGTTVYMFLTGSAGSVPRFAITTNSNGSEQQINGTSALSTGIWTHVAVTLSGTTGTLYVNGVQAGQNANMTLKPSSLGNTTQNYIGKSQWSDPYLNGLVDEFRIYNRALSASEVLSLAQ